MPQDTVLYNRDTSGHYIEPISDSLFSATVEDLRKEFIKEQDAQKNHGPSDFTIFLYTIGILALIWIIIRIRDGRSKSYVAFGSLVNNEADYDILENDGGPVAEEIDYLLYEGSELNFDDTEITKVLNKHSNYFTGLSETDKDKFLYRIHKFMKLKTFFIHDKSGFKEMPILISAAAIQLSFGLEKYLLPDFPNIHIFPEEFIAAEPLRVLEGNVSNNSINISWKHFLNGFNNPDDGQNVGLHELAHAYYYQNFETPNQVDRGFVTDFNNFNNYGNKVFEQELQPGNDLYSDYALKNFQEFWAESVEIFFEKPGRLKAVYPNLYTAISEILNQDPAIGNTGQ